MTMQHTSEKLVFWHNTLQGLVERWNFMSARVDQRKCLRYRLTFRPFGFISSKGTNTQSVVSHIRYHLSFHVHCFPVALAIKSQSPARNGVIVTTLLPTSLSIHWRCRGSLHTSIVFASAQNGATINQRSSEENEHLHGHKRMGDATALDVLVSFFTHGAESPNIQTH